MMYPTICACRSGPDYDDALFYFFTNYLRFSPSFMGTLRFTYGIAALLGVALYQWKLKSLSYRAVCCIRVSGVVRTGESLRMWWQAPKVLHIAVVISRLLFCHHHPSVFICRSSFLYHSTVIYLMCVH